MATVLTVCRQEPCVQARSVRPRLAPGVRTEVVDRLGLGWRGLPRMGCV